MYWNDCLQSGVEIRFSDDLKKACIKAMINASPAVFKLMDDRDTDYIHKTVHSVTADFDYNLITPYYPWPGWTFKVRDRWYKIYQEDTAGYVAIRDMGTEPWMKA
jgi:hypothetical protein